LTALTPVTGISITNPIDTIVDGPQLLTPERPIPDKELSCKLRDRYSAIAQARRECIDLPDYRTCIEWLRSMSRAHKPSNASQSGRKRPKHVGVNEMRVDESGLKRAQSAHQARKRHRAAVTAHL
jgi:hypothetical protein